MRNDELALKHAALSWKIIEYKIMYYYPEKVHKDWVKELDIPDDVYDDLELQYLVMCRRLSVVNSLVHKTHPGMKVSGKGMMEVDFDRPSVKLVLSKISKPCRYFKETK